MSETKDHHYPRLTEAETTEVTNRLAGCRRDLSAVEEQLRAFGTTHYDYLALDLGRAAVMIRAVIERIAKDLDDA